MTRPRWRPGVDVLTRRLWLQAQARDPHLMPAACLLCLPLAPAQRRAAVLRGLELVMAADQDRRRAAWPETARRALTEVAFRLMAEGANVAALELLRQREDPPRSPFALRVLLRVFSAPPKP